MPLLGLFTKKDKSKVSSRTSTATADDGDSVDADYILPPSSASMPSLANGRADYASSNTSLVSSSNASKKLRLPFRRKHAEATGSPLSNSLDLAPASPDGTTIRSVSSTSPSALSPLSRPSVFPSFHDTVAAPTSVRSLPPEARSRPDPSAKLKPESPEASKSGSGLFAWSHRERKKSKVTNPDPGTPTLPPLPIESFNLKSFRHVQPERSPDSPTASNANSSQMTNGSFLSATARPRGNSVVSTDSAQRISVAAFREAQARRSSTNVAGLLPSSRPVSRADSVDSDTTPPRPPRGTRPPLSVARYSTASPASPSGASSSSDASSTEEDSDSEDGSPSRSRSRLSRQRTITKRSYGTKSDLGHSNPGPSRSSHHQQTTSTRSELGHESTSQTMHVSPSRGPPPSSFQKSSNTLVGTRSLSIYRRQRASYSTSELTPNAAAQRASTLAAVNIRDSTAKSRNAFGGGSDTSESDSGNDSSDEDAPLASLMLPKRPGSSVSHNSNGTSAPVRSKPLIDLNVERDPLTGKPAVDRNKFEAKPARPTLISPTNIGNRLAQLTENAGLANTYTKTSASKSEDNLTFPSRSTSPKSLSKQNTIRAAAPSSPVSSRTLSPPPTKAPTSPTSSGRKTPTPLDSTPVSSTDQKSGKMPSDNFRPIPVKGRPEHESGFTVISRPKKSATSPTPITAPPRSDSLPLPKVSPKETQPTPVRYHRPHSSSFSVTSRPINAVPTLDTTPLVTPQENVNIKPSPRSTSPHMTSSQPPVQRPFTTGKRQDSPASSTGGSSNGKAPLTPMDGSDYFSPDVRTNGDSPNGSATGVPSAMKGGRGHPKRVSVSFQEPGGPFKDGKEYGRSQSFELPRPEDISVEERESRRRERRRSEAKAAIELGNVINGRGPATDDDSEDTESSVHATLGPRMNMYNQMTFPNSVAGGPMNFSNVPMPWQQQGMPSPLAPLNTQQFMIPQPPLNADPAYLAAHQQAMLIAKQAYQFAVAQQAMAAAADEWERGSNVGGFSGASAGGMGVGFGMGGMNGMNGIPVNMGMGGMPMTSMWGGTGSMYSTGPRSMYAGSSIGGPPSDAGWGAASVYGDAFGPSVPATVKRSANPRSQGAGGSRGIAFPTQPYQRSESSGNLQVPAREVRSSAPRPRTRTAPSTQQTTPHSRNPPSSWRVGS